MKSSMFERAWESQHHFDALLHSFMKTVTLCGYLFFLSLLFITVGIGLFLFVLLCHIPFIVLGLFSNPLFYLGVGITLIFTYLLLRRFDKNDGVEM